MKSLPQSMAPARGPCPFWNPALTHPAACLLSWFIVVVALPSLSWPALFILAIALALSGQGVRRRGWVLVRRARWLLLTLGAILAYGTPGEAWLDLPWAPTETGMHEASLHAVRLVLMLGLLAGLFEILPRERLMAGLWAVLQPLRAWRIDADRLVVRLSLVFDYLEKAPPRGSWRHLLDESREVDGEVAVVRIELPRWRPQDTSLLAGTVLTMAGVVWLS